MLNYYLATHRNKLHWLWTIVDASVLGVFIFAFVKSFLFLEQSKRRQLQIIKAEEGLLNRGQLPLGWMAWLVYSIPLAVRMALLFENVVQTLDEKDYFGPNTLKLAIASAAFICLLLIATHHDAPLGSSEHSFISGLSKGATFDILDTVAILEILFIYDSHIFLTFEMHKTIIAIAFINLLLPTIPLLILSRTRFGKEGMTTGLKIAHTLIYMVCVNVPLFVIRLILWHVRNLNISVFLIKNILGESVIDFDCLIWPCLTSSEVRVNRQCKSLPRETKPAPTKHESNERQWESTDVLVAKKNWTPSPS